MKEIITKELFIKIMGYDLSYFNINRTHDYIEFKRVDDEMLVLAEHQICTINDLFFSCLKLLTTTNNYFCLHYNVEWGDRLEKPYYIDFYNTKSIPKYHDEDIRNTVFKACQWILGNKLSEFHYEDEFTEKNREC